MDKEMLAFEMFKDEILECSKELRIKVEKAFKEYDFSIKNLYAKIINYQIDKYGTQLSFGDTYETKDEFIKKHYQAKNRMKAKKRYYRDRW